MTSETTMHTHRISQFLALTFKILPLTFENFYLPMTSETTMYTQKISQLLALTFKILPLTFENFENSCPWHSPSLHSRPHTSKSTMYKQRISGIPELTSRIFLWFSRISACPYRTSSFHSHTYVRIYYVQKENFWDSRADSRDFLFAFQEFQLPIPQPIFPLSPAYIWIYYVHTENFRDSQADFREF